MTIKIIHRNGITSTHTHALALGDNGTHIWVKTSEPSTFSRIPISEVSSIQVYPLDEEVNATLSS